MLTPKQFVSIFKSFYSVWDADKYNTLMNSFDLDETKKLSKFSKGMKMKFHIAFALSHKAKVLILDEPTSGLDPFVRSDFLNLALEEAKRGVSILFSTHITEDILKIADRIILISNGSLKFNLPASGIDNSCFSIDSENIKQMTKYPYEIIDSFEDQHIIWINPETLRDLDRSITLKSINFEDLLNIMNERDG